MKDRSSLTGLGLALAITLAAPHLRADTLDVCLKAADEGQALRDQGKLRAARERFVSCSSASCPGLVRGDCAGWLAGVEARIPSVVLAAADGEGRDLADVTVTIDGVSRPEGVDGRAVPLDPGAHRFQFRRGSGAVVEEQVILREGERGRVVTGRFGPPRRPGPQPSTGPSRGAVAASIVLGGVALGGAGVFAGLATIAKNDLADLRATCAPHCTPAQVDAVRAKEIGANVALGVGIAAAVAAVLVLVLRPGGEVKAAVGAWIRLAPPVRGGAGGPGGSPDGPMIGATF